MSGGGGLNSWGQWGVGRGGGATDPRIDDVINE